MNKLSVYIIAFNEEEKIKQALESVKWADEIIVADSFSTDNTAVIAKKYGARVIQIPEVLNRPEKRSRKLLIPNTVLMPTMSREEIILWANGLSMPDFTLISGNPSFFENRP